MVMTSTLETLNLTDRREAIGSGGVVTMRDGMPRRSVVEDKMRRTGCIWTEGRVIFGGRRRDSDEILWGTGTSPIGNVEGAGEATMIGDGGTESEA
jgi:hypothetical protein